MAKRFSKIFTAQVSFGDDVTVSQDRRKSVYGRAGAAVKLPDGQVVNRTVMAFGNQLVSVQPDFVPGNVVDLAVQFDGGTLKVIGYPREQATAKAA